MPTRRELGAALVAAATTFGLVAALGPRRALAAPLRAPIEGWLRELRTLAADLRGRRLSDLEFEAQIAALLRRVELADLAAAIDLDVLTRDLVPPERGAAGLDLGALVPAGVGLRTRLFVCREGRSIVPHGHVNLCTGALVLRGRWRGRHYDRVETRGDFHTLRPTRDRELAPGEVSTVSDHQNNVHWFEATTEVAVLFNAHVAGYDPHLRGSPGRIYLDPAGPPRGDGLIDAPTMTHADCLAKYG